MSELVQIQVSRICVDYGEHCNRFVMEIRIFCCWIL